MLNKKVSCPPTLALPLNFKWLVPNRLSGMSRPGIGASNQAWLEAHSDHFDGQIMRQELDHLHQMGIRQLISLATESRDEIRMYWESKSGTQFRALTLPNCTAPVNKEAAFFEEFVSYIDEAQGPTAIHCNGGIGRTGLMLAAYFLKHPELTMASSKSIKMYRSYDFDAEGHVQIPVPASVANAIDHVRAHYNAHAIEFSNQLTALAKWASVT